MADSVEKWGDDIDSAVELALRDLKLTRDEVIVTVLEEPSKGFLGLFGSKLARVKVERKPAEEKKPEKKEEPAIPEQDLDPELEKDLELEAEYGGAMDSFEKIPPRTPKKSPAKHTNRDGKKQKTQRTEYS